MQQNVVQSAGVNAQFHEFSHFSRICRKKRVNFVQKCDYTIFEYLTFWTSKIFNSTPIVYLTAALWTMFTKCHFRSQKVWGPYSLIFQIVSYKKVILLMREFFFFLFFMRKRGKSWQSGPFSQKKSTPRLLLRTTIFVWGTQQIVRFFYSHASRQ